MRTGFDPNQPRDRIGRWTDDADAAVPSAAAIEQRVRTTTRTSDGGTRQVTAESFDSRVARAAKGEDALAAATLGVGRRPRPEGFSRSLEKSVGMYADRWFTEVNAALRGQPLQDERDRERVNEINADMDEVFTRTKVSRDVVAYRGAKDGSTIFGAAVAGDLTGAEWTDKAWLSTTVTEGRTRTFLGRDSGRLLMRVLVPAGTPAIEASPASAEAELLLRRGLRYRVAADHGTDAEGVRRIDVEVMR